MSRLKFELHKKDPKSKARVGVFHTTHGSVKTPIFMPVGTKATVRSQTLNTLHSAQSQIILGNTYHLINRPGLEVFDHFGGLHNFMKWQKPILTDSGGFQIFSLPEVKIDDHGAVFSSYVDGKKILLTPETSIDAQTRIGSDIMMVLDHCIDSTSPKEKAIEAMNRTHTWALRSLNARKNENQALFAIIQGTCVKELREQSAKTLTALPFDGFAIGGLAVGETKEERETITDFTTDFMPTHLPRYLMGVGTPIDLLEAVKRGVDMFDCVMPTALAQQGVAFTSRGKIDIRRGVHKFSQFKLDPECVCSTCATYERAYLHHLIKAREVLGWHLIAAHNIHFYLNLMGNIRESILNDQFIEFYEKTKPTLEAIDLDHPAKEQKSKAPRRPTELGDYAVRIEPKNNWASIRQISSNEVMHSVNDPMSEAKKLYVEQSNLAELLETKEELTIWDVGLGAAFNAMSIIEAYEKSSKKCKLTIISFECDLNALKLTLQRADLFAHIRHKAPNEIIKKQQYVAETLEWNLILGDFLETYKNAPRPDIIFFDPFSYKTDSNMWTLEVFQLIADQCGTEECKLYTYTISTAVRAMLLAAGFYVGSGLATGPKAETTIAYLNSKNKIQNILGSKFIEKFNRSGATYPQHYSEIEIANIRQKVQTHSQFVNL